MARPVKLEPRPSIPPGPYLVAGLAKAGAAAAAALRSTTDEPVVAWDEHRCDPTEAAASRLSALGVEIVFGEPDGLLDRHGGFGSIVKSPGIPGDIDLLAAARARGIPVIDELELGWRLADGKLIAVTGTNGKSTTVALLRRALERAGMEALVAGNSDLGPALSAVPHDGAEWIVCEVSSFQLEATTHFLPQAALLTNLTHDHLHRHGTMAAYGECKRRMFVRGDRAVPGAAINLDDDFGHDLAGDIERRGGRVAGFGRSSEAEFRMLACEWSRDEGRVSLSTPGGGVELVTRLPGLHNAYNVAGAAALCHLLGLDEGTTAAALSEAPNVPGRWEPVDEGQPFDAIVDYAHNTEGMTNVLETARAVAAGRGGTVRTVSGAGGGNDPSKRPAMGRELRRLSDQLILTEGNSRGEPGAEVIADLLEGAEPTAGATLEVIPDRRLAIRRALSCAQPGDIVLVLGRGAMPRLLASTSGDGPAFDDRVVVREELRALAP